MCKRENEKSQNTRDIFGVDTCTSDQSHIKTATRIQWNGMEQKKAKDRQTASREKKDEIERDREREREVFHLQIS